MKKNLVSLAAAAMLAGGVVSLQAQDMRSSWSGVFNSAQADRGKALFMDNCAKCHGETLQGDEAAPQLAGPNFLSNWNGETVNDLVERIRTTMPADDPGKFSRPSATDLATFILSSNGMPSGAAELPRDQPVQQQIRIDGNKPN